MCSEYLLIKPRLASQISALFERYCTNPVFVIIDVRPDIVGIPTTAYQAVDEVERDGREIQKVFQHISCGIEAEEAEEVLIFQSLLKAHITHSSYFQVGVEHLLRDINDPTTSQLALDIKQKVHGLRGLQGRLQDIHEYLSKVSNGTMPINNQISYNLQNILNLLPNLNVEELVKAMLVKTNDIHLVMYVSALVRSILALHDLLNNKIKYKDMDDILDRDAGMEVGNKKEAAKEKEISANSSPVRTPKTPDSNNEK